MKYDKLFNLAKEKGIEEIELAFSTSNKLSFSLFHGEVDSYNSASSASYIIRGIYKGKLGSVSSDVYSNDLVEYFVDEIINNAKFIENDDPVFIFGGSEKYKKVNTYNRELGKISIDEKMKKLHELEDKIRNYFSKPINIINSGIILAEELNDGERKEPKLEFYVSGDKEEFREHGKRFIDIDDLTELHNI